MGKVRIWLAGALVALMAAGCTPMDDLLVTIFGRSMRDQPSFNPYENPQPPPEGSVPFASGNFPAAPGEVNLGQPEGTPVPAPVLPADMLRALTNPDEVPQVTGLDNPIAPDAESLERGEVLFQRACAPCHGVDGQGDGPVSEVAPVFGVSLMSDQALGLVDGYVYSMIRVGRGAMPALGHQITHYDRWHVVNYVRELQGQLPDAESSEN